VLRASDSFFANRRDLIRARYATVVGLLQLKAATASLNLDEVARVNELVLNGEDRQAVAHVDAQHAAVDAKVERAAVGAKMGRPAVGTEMPRALVRAEPPQGVILTDLHPAAIDAAVQRALASIHQQ
jgi:outer membrane protein